MLDHLRTAGKPPGAATEERQQRHQVNRQATEEHCQAADGDTYSHAEPRDTAGTGPPKPPKLRHMNPSPERNPPQTAPPRKTRRTARRRRPIQAGFWAFTREEEQGWKGVGPLQHLQGGDGVGDVAAARPAKPANGFPRPKTRPPNTHPHHIGTREEAGEKRRGRGRQGKGANLRSDEEGKTSVPLPPPAVVSPPAWSRPPARAHPRTTPAEKAPPPRQEGPPPQIRGPPRGKERPRPRRHLHGQPHARTRRQTRVAAREGG